MPKLNILLVLLCGPHWPTDRISQSRARDRAFLAPY